MPQDIVVVDAFTDRPFAGNPAAVCLLDRERDAGWMQRLAREMNHSETAFLLPGDDGYRLRWFTPAVEVDLCGHATLASAHVLFESGMAAAGDIVTFHTRSGALTASRTGSWVTLDFPALPEEPAPQPEGISRALGAAPKYVGRSRHDLLVEVENEEVLRGLRPDFRKLAALPARGVIATCRGLRAPGDSGARTGVSAARTGDSDARTGDSAAPDFLSRFFAPAAGVDEDPVTGSAHCVLGPYWADRLGKGELTGYQCSARGGTVRVTVRRDRVLLGGQAVTVLRSRLVAE